MLLLYLPYQCNDNYDEYLNCMNKIVQIVFEYPNANFYVMGDFNSDFTRGDLFGNEFMQICRGDWGPLGHGVHWDTPSNRKSLTYRAHEMQFPGCSGTPLVQEH